jgi:hemoglobin-like flavoprotein
METKTINIIQKSFEKVRPLATTTAEHFYDKLFEFDPKLKSLFPATNKEAMLQQGDKLMMVLSSAVASLHNFDKLIPILSNLGKRHVDYNVQPIHYDIVGTALLASIANSLQEDFTLEVELAWCQFYTTIANTMKNSAYKH